LAIAPTVKERGLVPLTALIVAVPAVTVKLVNACALPVGDPTFPMRTESVLLLQVLVVHAIVTSGRLVPVLTRVPVPLAMVTAPVLDATLKVVAPVGADTTLPIFGPAVIDDTV
jgi:hypothetical protein